MLNYPTVKQLRYFIALEQQGHFGKAAESCFVSQSAFSVAIKEMENTLGVQLVDRDNKNVTITAIGKDVAVHARLVVCELDRLVETAGSSQAPLTGKLKMGIIPTIAPFLLLFLLPQLGKNYPQLELFLHEDFTYRIYEHLLSGDMDLIVVALPYEFKKVESMQVFRDRFYFASKKGTKLTKSRKFSIEQLPEKSILLLEDGHCLREHALSACKIRNLDKVSQMSASSILTLIQMIEADLGVSFLPELACRSTMFKYSNIRFAPMSVNSYRDIGLVWRKGSARKKEFKLLGDIISKVLS